MKQLHSAALLVLSLVLSLVFLVCKQADQATSPETEDADRITAIDNLIKAAGDYTEPDSSYSETKVVEEESRGIELWRCVRTTIDARLAPDRFSIFDPNAEVIWPGAALQGKSIQFPTPDPIIARRAGGSVIINNITGNPLSSVSLAEVTQSNVISAANEIIRNQSDKFPADVAISYARVRSKEELALKLGANASFFGLFSSKGRFELTDKEEVSTFIVTLSQSFYTLVFERPARAADFFHQEVTANDLKPFVGPGNYPVYVSSVTYGRTFYLLVSAVENAETIKASLSASFIFGGFKGDFTHVSSLKGLYVQAFALGGDAQEAFNAVIGGIGSLDNFIAHLRNAADIRLAKPLSYAIRSVQSATLVKNEVNTKFTVSDCAPVFAVSDLSIDPAYINFGDVCAGKTASRAIVIRNNGAIKVALDVKASSTCGIANRQTCFPIDPKGTFELESGSSKVFQVTFTPCFGGLGGIGCCGYLDCPVTLKLKAGNQENIVTIPAFGRGIHSASSDYSSQCR